METKVCGICKIEKSLSEFTTDSSKGYLKYGKCKSCKKIYMHKYNQRPDVKKIKEIKSKTDPRHIKLRKERQKKYHRIKKYTYPEKRNLREKERRNNDPKLKLHDSMRSRMRHDLKKGKAGITSSEILNNILHYDINELKNHLEKQFKKGMNWGNYGLSGWHIDHKIPVAAFNFKSPNDIDFKRCWSLENLQPMWAKDNCSKGARITKPFQPSLLLEIGG